VRRATARSTVWKLRWPTIRPGPAVHVTEPGFRTLRSVGDIMRPGESLASPAL
jgi:hypothetical protein